MPAVVRSTTAFLHIVLYKYIYSNEILPAVLCACETWSLTMREERRLRVFENRVLREISRSMWAIY